MPTGLRNPMSPTRNRLSFLAKRTGDRDCQTHSKCSKMGVSGPTQTQQWEGDMTLIVDASARGSRWEWEVDAGV